MGMSNIITVAENIFLRAYILQSNKYLTQLSRLHRAIICMAFLASFCSNIEIHKRVKYEFPFLVTVAIIGCPLQLESI